MQTKTYKPIDDMIRTTGLKMGAVADLMGVTPSMLWRLRVDPTKMSVGQMEKFGEIVGVDFFTVYETTKKFTEKVDLIAT